MNDKTNRTNKLTRNYYFYNQKKQQQIGNFNMFLCDAKRKGYFLFHVLYLPLNWYTGEKQITGWIR